MASSYVNDLRLNEMATGDASGTWGDTTNTNLELIAEAFSYGTEAITTNADTHTTTIADGATDPGRSMFLKYTGTLDSTCTITIGPNTVSKLWIIENGTSGSQSIIIKQGSGATITIPSGKTKVIYSDGAGSGGAMFDAFASLNLQTSGIIETSASIQTALIEYTDGDDAMTIADGGGVTFAQTATFSGDIDLAGSIDVDGTTNLDVVDIDGAVDMASTLAVGGVVTVIDGSTSAPSVTNAGDTNTGIYFPSDDNFGIVVGGSRKLLANSSGVSINNGVLDADGGITVDNITIDGNEIDLSSGDLTIDVAGDLILDFAGDDLKFVSNGSQYGLLSKSSNSLLIRSTIADGDIVLQGSDDGDIVTALTLDMSNAGKAAFNAGATFNSNVAISTADNTDTLTLVSTDADANAGPILVFDRTSGSPADNDLIGQIVFQARNDAGQDTDYAAVKSYILDASDGTEDGQYNIETMVAGTLQTRLLVASNEIVLNESSIDTDFRVESNGKTHMLFVDGGNDRVGIMNSAPATSLHIGDSSGSQQIRLESNGGGASIKGTDTVNNASSGYTVGHLNGTNRYELTLGTIPIFDMYKTAVIFNEGSVDMDFRVESNGNANMLFVDGGNDSVNIAGSSDPSKGNLVVTGSANSAASSHRPAVLSRGSFGGGIASLDTLESGWYQLTNGTVWNLYHGRNTSSDTPASKIVQTFNSGETVFNESSRDLDFRVESNGNANMFFVDGGNNEIGIGTNAPDTILHVHKATAGSVTALSDSTLVLENNTHNYLTFLSPNDKEQAIIFGDANNNNNASVGYNHNTDNLSISSVDDIVFNTSGVTRGRFTDNGLCFNADTAAGNALDDYEEGTWTPTSGVNLSILTTCHYLKIGKHLTVTFDITFASNSDGNAVSLNSLPFSYTSYNSGFNGWNNTGSVAVWHIAGSSAALYNGESNAVFTYAAVSGKRLIGTITGILT